MPDADGTIRPVTVPTVPWLQTFKPGDTVRVIVADETVGFAGDEGLVIDGPSGFGDRSVTVDLGDKDTGGVWCFRPGELRLVTA